MVKKISVIMILVVIIFGMMTITTKTFADTMTGEEVLNSDQATELLEMKESAKGVLQDYVDKYGSTPYGIVAYVLNAIRIYSIPFCFMGIALGSIYQYVIGIRKLDVRDKGFTLIISFVTILLICQITPLIFAIIVNGWRG